MRLPTLLVAEPEPEQALSVRNLVLETAKFNVLTARYTREAINIFHLFPNISGAILACGENIDCDKIAATIQSTTQKVAVIVLLPHVAPHSTVGDHNVSSHESKELLELVQSLFWGSKTL